MDEIHFFDILFRRKLKKGREIQIRNPIKYKNFDQKNGIFFLKFSPEILFLYSTFYRENDSFLVNLNRFSRQNRKSFRVFIFTYFLLFLHWESSVSNEIWIKWKEIKNTKNLSKWTSWYFFNQKMSTENKEKYYKLC